MNEPRMHAPIDAGNGVHVLPAYLPVPGFGVLPVNASVLDGPEPVLVDTGLAGLRHDFLNALCSLIDPAALRWIWLTHMDLDHVGNLGALLDLAPSARVVTTYLGMGKLGLLGLPQNRAYLLNPGQELALADRTLSCLRPPSFDAPETTALFDRASGTYFSADCFGALMAEPAESAAAIPPEALAEGLTTWATVDSPWLHWMDPEPFRQRLQALRRLAPARIVSSHLPPAEGMDETLFRSLDAARGTREFVGPDQSELEALMAA